MVHTKGFTHITRQIALLIFASLVFLCGLQLQLGLRASAATATLGYSPGTGEIHPNEEIVLGVTIAAGDGKVAAAQACIAYDSTKLEFVSLDYNGTPLDWFTPQDASSDCPAGQVQAGRFSPDKRPTGTFTLVNVRFKAKTELGDTAVSFGSKSFVFDDQTNASTGPTGILTGSGTGTVKITALPVPAAPPVEEKKKNTAPAPVAATPVPAISDSERETEQATSTDVVLPVVATTNIETAKVAASKRTMYILVGVTAAAIIAAIFMAKLLGAPRMSRRNNGGTGFTPPPAAPIIGAGPSAPTSVHPTPTQPLPPSAPVDKTPEATIGRLPDANIPGPSTVIQPTEHHEDN